MLYYQIKNENKELLYSFEGTKENFEELESRFGKSIKEINEELKNNGYFIYNNNKCYIEKIFIDFIDEDSDY